MHWSQIFHFIVAMFAITNPIGNLAIFIGLTADRSIKEQKRVACTTAFSVLIVLLIILWLGTWVLKLFGITLSSFEIAGGLVITLIGLSMLQSKKSKISMTTTEGKQAKIKDSIAVVPMTIPIIAGPGAMTTVIIFAKHYPYALDKLYLSGGILVIAIVIFVALYFSAWIHKLLGDAGTKIATRVMGLILMAIAIGMVVEGLKEAFPALMA